MGYMHSCLLKDFFLEKYTDSSSTKNNPAFFLLRYLSVIPDILKKKFKHFAVREISPSLFIIKSNALLLSSLEKQLISVYKANNTWELSPLV